MAALISTFYIENVQLKKVVFVKYIFRLITMEINKWIIIIKQVASSPLPKSVVTLSSFLMSFTISFLVNSATILQ